MTNYDPVYLSINDKPHAILDAMDRLKVQRDQQADTVARRRWVPLALLIVGLPFCCLDFALGYDALLFSFVGVGLLVAAAFAWMTLRRARPAQATQPGKEFGPHYETARAVITVLRDDLHPGRNFFGHVDLTGPEQPSKKLRTGANALGQTVEYYRDDWLNLKTKLYDGNMLRFAATERAKVRQGYYKRGTISGKQKWKPPKAKSGQEVSVRLSVNPQVYRIAGNRAARPSAKVGAYTIDTFDTSGGIVEIKASTAATTINAGDVLGVLRAAYSVLQRV